MASPYPLSFCACLLLVSPAQAGTDRFGVTFVPGATAHAHIEKATAADGIGLIDYARNAKHSVLMVRRSKPGEAEVHTAITDVWYVIDGGGTLVTGGKLVGGKRPNAGELRGSAITGGVPHHLARGDLIDIPAGIPHWVSGIDGKELVYLTVKVATPPG